MATYTVSTTDELKQRTADADPGDEIVARGGTYEMTSRWTVTNGGSDNDPIVIRATDGEIPHITFDTNDSDSGIQFRGPYVHFVGFEVSHSTWKGVNTDGNAHDVVFEDLDVHDCRLWGIMNNDGDNVVFRNCDSHHNDGNPENSDGFNMTGSATNGLIEGCRAWANGDDGYDFWVSSNHTIRDCWAWDNGRGSEGDGNGFKLGGNNEGGGHVVHNCVAFDNRYRGFDWNTTDNPVELYNCTAVDNDPNYRFRDTDHTLRNNISVGGSVALSSVVDDEYNSWNLDIEDPVFRSTDPESPDFLRLDESSPAIDSGVDVGLPYNGDAPDLGAFEFGGESSSTRTRTTLDGEVTIGAADATTNRETYLSDHHDGYTGDGYVQLEPDTGGYASWGLEVPEARAYNFEIRYANGASSDRTANMTYAGDYQQVTFQETEGWSDWETVEGRVDLPSGEVDLAIETTGQDAGNIDQLRLWPVEDETPDQRAVLDTEVTIGASDAATNPESYLSEYHDGYTDNGYVQLEPENGSFAKWELEVPEAQAYNFEIRYANGGSSDRTANMTYAGDYQQVTFQETGGWSEWETVESRVDLPSGEVDLAIETTGQDAGNIDQIRLWPVEDETTRAEPTGDTPNHGLSTPDEGDEEWHIPLNENFEAIDRSIPIVDQEGAKGEYAPVERSLYIAINTGVVYVGDGSEWTELGSLQ